MEKPNPIPEGQSDNPLLSPEELERLRAAAVSEASGPLFDLKTVEEHLLAAYDIGVVLEQDSSQKTAFLEHLNQAEHHSQSHPNLHRLILAAIATYLADGTIPDWMPLADALYKKLNEP